MSDERANVSIGGDVGGHVTVGDNNTTAGEIAKSTSQPNLITQLWEQVKKWFGFGDQKEQ